MMHTGKKTQIEFLKSKYGFMRESSIFDFQKKIVLARKFKIKFSQVFIESSIFGKISDFCPSV